MERETKMQLIKRLGVRRERRRYTISWALFLCPLCNKQVEKPLMEGRCTESCGCQGKARNVKVTDEVVVEEENEILKTNTREGMRKCLLCKKEFKSRGPHNRRCEKCDLKVSQWDNTSFYEPYVYVHLPGTYKGLLESQ